MDTKTLTATRSSLATKPPLLAAVQSASASHAPQETCGLLELRPSEAPRRSGWWPAHNGFAFAPTAEDAAEEIAKLAWRQLDCPP